MKKGRVKRYGAGTEETKQGCPLYLLVSIGVIAFINKPLEVF